MRKDRAMNARSAGLALAVAGGLSLSGCVTVPVGPAVPVMPGAYKSAAEFGADDANCRNYAQAAIGGAAQAATDNAAASAAAGTFMGAITGALIGAAVGDAGTGAAIGAGTGLLWGGAASAPGYTSYDLQRRYDTFYAQCMHARGNQFPGRVTYRAAPYPPPNTPAPRGLGPGAPVTPPPAAAQPGNYPPPGTPAPIGLGGTTQGRIVPAPINPPPAYPPAGTPPPGTPAPPL
jgi:hypothetical protein